MTRYLIAIVMAFTLVSSSAEEATPAPEESKPSEQEPAKESAPREMPVQTPVESDRVQPGNLKETVSRSLQLFVPSEEIDVDKPVDFPTNI